MPFGLGSWVYTKERIRDWYSLLLPAVGAFKTSRASMPVNDPGGWFHQISTQAKRGGGSRDARWQTKVSGVFETTINVGPDRHTSGVGLGYEPSNSLEVHSSRRQKKKGLDYLYQSKETYLKYDITEDSGHLLWYSVEGVLFTSSEGRSFRRIGRVKLYELADVLGLSTREQSLEPYVPIQALILSVWRIWQCRVCLTSNDTGFIEYVSGFDQGR